MRICHHLDKMRRGRYIPSLTRSCLGCIYSKQWAAVTTHSGESRVPPHFSLWSCIIRACQQKAYICLISNVFDINLSRDGFHIASFCLFMQLCFTLPCWLHGELSRGSLPIDIFFILWSGPYLLWPRVYPWKLQLKFLLAVKLRTKGSGDRDNCATTLLLCNQVLQNKVNVPKWNRWICCPWMKKEFGYQDMALLMNF